MEQITQTKANRDLAYLKDIKNLHKCTFCPENNNYNLLNPKRLPCGVKECWVKIYANSED